MLIPASVGLWQYTVRAPGLNWACAVLCVILAAFGIKESYRPERCPGPCAAFVLSGLAAAGGAAATYILAQETLLGVVAASGAVGLGAAFFLRGRSLDLPAYAGAFVGMSSPAVLPSLGLVVFAGFLAGCIYEAVHGIFEGVGGRLGTMAAAAVLLTLLLWGVSS